MSDLDKIDALAAEVAALRVVAERLLSHCFADGSNPQKLLMQDMLAACKDLGARTLSDASIEKQAQAYLVQIYVRSQQASPPRAAEVSDSIIRATKPKNTYN